MILFVDACVRAQSRTRRLAEAVLAKMDGEVTRLRLADIELPALTETDIETRAARDFSHPVYDLARQFAQADEIVIAAPYWDLSFPALLKRYLEHVCVAGITFRYSPEGIPQGLCRAKRLTYVTTSGGPLLAPAFGCGYVETLAKMMFGIGECRCVSCENLDIVGNDPEALLKNAMEAL